MRLTNKLFTRSLLAGLCLFGIPNIQAEVIFEENFDNQPDWNSGLPENDRGQLDMPPSGRGGWPVDISQFAETHVIPENWSFVRQTPVWAPSRGDVDRHEVIEISSASTAENPNRARSGSGKSFVSWRDSSTLQFGSDGLLMKHFPEGFDQIYVEFWINFSKEQIESYYDTNYPADQALSKLFRIYHWDGTGSAFDYYDNNINPNMIWGMEGRSVAAKGYGFRNSIALLNRRASLDDNNRFIDPNGNYQAGPPSSYLPKTRIPYGGVELADKRDGGLLDTNNFVADIDQVFGDETQWTKMAFFVKMNSAPGAYDGTLIQWLDGRKVMEINTIAWVTEGRNMVKWTTFGIGGNDSFKKYPNELRHEEWYAIDDVMASTQIPDHLLSESESIAPPNSPMDLNVE